MNPSSKYKYSFPLDLILWLIQNEHLPFSPLIMNINFYQSLPESCACHRVLQPAGGCLDIIHECSVIFNVQGLAEGERVAAHRRRTASHVLVKLGEGTAAASDAHSRLSLSRRNVVSTCLVVVQHRIQAKP